MAFFIFDGMKYWFIFSLLFAGLNVQGQLDPEAVRQKVLKALKEKRVPTSRDSSYLVAGAWEALAYLEDTTTENLFQAVPDYYSFKNGKLLLKLINPQNKNEYGVEIEVNYKLLNNKLLLFDTNTGELKSTWKLLYLDKNYLGMEMDGLFVFFTHTPLQE